MNEKPIYEPTQEEISSQNETMPLQELLKSAQQMLDSYNNPETQQRLKEIIEKTQQTIQEIIEETQGQLGGLRSEMESSQNPVGSDGIDTSNGTDALDGGVSDLAGLAEDLYGIDYNNSEASELLQKVGCKENKYLDTNSIQGNKTEINTKDELKSAFGENINDKISKMYYTDSDDKIIIHNVSSENNVMMSVDSREGYFIDKNVLKDYLVTNIEDGNLNPHLTEDRSIKEELVQKVEGAIPDGFKSFIEVSSDNDNNEYANLLSNGNLQEISGYKELLSGLGFSGVENKEDLKNLILSGLKPELTPVQYDIDKIGIVISRESATKTGGIVGYNTIKEDVGFIDLGKIQDVQYGKVNSLVSNLQTWYDGLDDNLQNNGTRRENLGDYFSSLR